MGCIKAERETGAFLPGGAGIHGVLKNHLGFETQPQTTI
jgi:hypothetical protein